MPPSSSLIDLDSMTTGTGPYRWPSHFKLDNAYPIVEGYEDAAGRTTAAVGMRLNFSDRVGATSLDLTGSWSPTQDSTYERPHLRAVFRHWNWKVVAAFNRADFYDLFGPTKESRRGYMLGVQYTGNLLFDAPRSLSYTLQVAGYGGLQIVPEFQGVAAPYSELFSWSADLDYGSLRRSLGAIADELGTSWNLSLRGNRAQDTLFFRLSAEATKGFLLPIPHSSLWFRAAAGTALAGDHANSFARFFFGGFGNNIVDHREIQQFRAAEAFPGIGINTVSGANYGRAQVEWTLPPLRFRRVGVPSMYLRFAQLSLFATGLVTDMEDPDLRQGLVSAGAQLDVRLVTLSHLNSTFSVGYGAAQADRGPLSSQWMFSFKIM